jgi:hypothetical protein
MKSNGKAGKAVIDERQERVKIATNSLLAVKIVEAAFYHYAARDESELFHFNLRNTE